MALLGVGIECKNDVAIKRLHNRDPRQHRVATAAAQHPGLNSRLPVRQVGFRLWQLRDVVRRVLQREQLPAVWQNDGILKRGRPGHAKCFSLKWGRGRHTGSAATPSRAVLRRGLIAICATEATLDVLSPVATKLTN